MKLAQVLLAAIGSVGIVFVMLVLSYEALAFLTGSPTISDIVRNWIRAYPFFAMLCVVLVGALLGHFFALG